MLLENVKGGRRYLVNLRHKYKENFVQEDTYYNSTNVSHSKVCRE